MAFVGDGKGAKALDAFRKRLRGSGAWTEAEATDVTLAQISTIPTHQPEAAFVFEHAASRGAG